VNILDICGESRSVVKAGFRKEVDEMKPRLKTRGLVSERKWSRYLQLNRYTAKFQIEKLLEVESSSNQHSWTVDHAAAFAVTACCTS